MRLFNFDFSNMHEVNLVQFNFLDLAPMKGVSVCVTPCLALRCFAYDDSQTRIKLASWVTLLCA